MSVAGLDDALRRQLRTAAGFDECDRNLAHSIVRHADDLHQLHTGQSLDEGFDFGCGDVLATDLQHILDTAEENEKPVLVDPPPVTGADPPIG